MTSNRDQRLRELVDDHGSFVKRALRNLGVLDGDLDDCVQKTFLAATNRLADIRPGSEKAFLFRCASNMAAHSRRALARKREVPDEVLASRHDPEQRPDVLTERKRHREMLDAALDALDDKLRTVFILHAFEEMTMAEIADVLGIPPGTVASRLRRARAMFKDQILLMKVMEKRESA
jgi:RNA polymerase sigma-70 factor (ECF subfamily)